MAVEIVERRSPLFGADEEMVEVFATEAEGRLFVPGARVDRRRAQFGDGSLEVTVGWSSSNSAGKLADAKLQLQVLARAIEIAEEMAR